MRVLVTGGTGLIGWQIVRDALSKGNEVFYTYHNNNINSEGASALNLDIRDRKETIKIIENVNPEIIIHTAALTNVDLCEKDKEQAVQINIEGTRNVLDGCKNVKSQMIFISSSFVFDGKKPIYHEDDARNPINYYGITKLKCEEMISSSGLDFLIIRTDQPYCWTMPWQKKSTVVRLLEELKAGQVTKVPLDWYNNPTFVDNLVEAILRLVEKNKTGIYHIVGHDFVSRYEWALTMAKIFDRNKDLVKPVKAQEIGAIAKRPNANLSNKKTESHGAIRLIGIDEGLRIMLKQLSDQQTLVDTK